MSVRVPIDYNPQNPHLSNAKSVKKGIMKYGFTTGTAVAACAKAVAMILKGLDVGGEVVVSTPIGLRLGIPILSIQREGEWASAYTKKNGGDDPDDTNGMIIGVKGRIRNDDIGYVTFRAGRGIGKATQAGLPVGLGEPAVNPVPRKQIIDALREVLGVSFGFELVVEAPEGERIGKRTFNPRLGIEGGISVLGTSGIVKPMSVVSWYASMVEQIDVVRSKGYSTIVLVPGNIGEEGASRYLNVPRDVIVQSAIFTGSMMKASVSKGFKEIILFGHIGKLIKHAVGIWNTHYKYGDARIEALVYFAVRGGLPYETLKRVSQTKTTDDAVNIIRASCPSWNYIFNDIANKIRENGLSLLKEKANVEVGLVDMKGNLLGATDGLKKHMG